MHLLAKRCKEMYGGPRKMYDRGFTNCGSNHQVTLTGPFGEYGILNGLHLFSLFAEFKFRCPIRVCDACFGPEKTELPCNTKHQASW